MAYHLFVLYKNMFVVNIHKKIFTVRGKSVIVAKSEYDRKRIIASKSEYASYRYLIIKKLPQRVMCIQIVFIKRSNVY